MSALIAKRSEKSTRFLTEFELKMLPTGNKNSLINIDSSYGMKPYHNHRYSDTPKITNNRIYLMINDLKNAAKVINGFGLYKVIDRINLFLAAENLRVFLTERIVRGEVK